jgi:hypothetical protein
MLLAAVAFALVAQVEVQWHRDGDLLTKTVMIDGMVHAVSSAKIPDCTVAFDLGADPHEMNAWRESPAPGSPHLANEPDGWQADYVPPAIVTESFDEASPVGWTFVGIPRGNNVLQVSAMWTGVGPVVILAPIDLSTTYEYDPAQSSIETYEAVGAAAFATINAAHDWFWHAGFQEADGAAQRENFGRGGIDGDPVLCEIFHNYGSPKYIAGCYCNATDGESPVLTLWNFFNDLLWPDRPSALDAGIVVHEYGHIVTTRLVGVPLNPDGTANVQGRSLSEGISDIFAMLWQAEPDDDPAWAHTIGAWPALHFIGNGEFYDNYWFGVRTYPYSTSLAISPRHLGHFDLDTYPLPPNVPASPLQIAQGNGWHQLGEIYAAFLWDVWSAMRERYPFETARDRMTRTIILSEKLAPLLPNYADMRDAFILADGIVNSGENWVPIWFAAAKRGLGAGALVPPSDKLKPVAPSFVPIDFGDWNVDGAKNALDAVAFQLDSLSPTLRADLNLDQTVDVLDWVIWMQNFAQ